MAKILVIDDEPSVLALLGAFLTGLGHEVISSGSGAAGLAAARESRPPVALVDLNLGDMSANELIPQCRAEIPEMTILLITGECGSESAEQARQLGAVGCIPKPFDLAGLKVAVDSALGQTIPSTGTPPAAG
jgi:DNA-binding NtrC family response regulator